MQWELPTLLGSLLQVQVSDRPLTAFGMRDDGAVLGCGNADGCCSVMQLSSALVDLVPNEKQTINAMFERETLRCAELGPRPCQSHKPGTYSMPASSCTVDNPLDDTVKTIRTTMLWGLLCYHAACTAALQGEELGEGDQRGQGQSTQVLELCRLAEPSCHSCQCLGCLCHSC
jgi:hypothetical protein